MHLMECDETVLQIPQKGLEACRCDGVDVSALAFLDVVQALAYQNHQLALCLQSTALDDEIRVILQYDLVGCRCLCGGTSHINDVILQVYRFVRSVLVLHKYTSSVFFDDLYILRPKRRRSLLHAVQFTVWNMLR